MRSQGTDWGESGTFRILRGSNECRIEEFVVGAWAVREAGRGGAAARRAFLTGSRAGRVGRHRRRNRRPSRGRKGRRGRRHRYYQVG